MAFNHTWQFSVRAYETGLNGNVHPAVYVNYLEEGATQASAAYGFTLDWYLARDQFWIVRRLQVHFYEPARLNDKLELHTWISDIRRVASHREYDLRRTSDGARVLRARHDWIYVNATALRPERVPTEFTERFKPDAVMEDLDIAIPDAVTIEDARLYTQERRVQTEELDLVGHVNNAHYIRWCENAVDGALREAGFTPGQPLPGGVEMRRIGHEIDYLRGARDNDPLLVRTRLAEVGGDRAAWITEVTHQETGEVLTRNRLTYAFSANGIACSPPPSFQLAMTAQKENLNG